MKAITPTQREALGELMDGGLGFVGDSTVRGGNLSERERAEDFFFGRTYSGAF